MNVYKWKHVLAAVGIATVIAAGWYGVFQTESGQEARLAAVPDLRFCNMQSLSTTAAEAEREKRCAMAQLDYIKLFVLNDE